MNTETEFKTQDNSPYSSDYDDEDDNEDNEYNYDPYKCGLQKMFYIPKEVHSDIDRNEQIYHVDPESVIKINPELKGKVFQAYLLCNLCHQYKKMTQTNSHIIPVSERSFYKEIYTGQHAYCMELECTKKYEELIRSLNKEK